MKSQYVQLAGENRVGLGRRMDVPYPWCLGDRGRGMDEKREPIGANVRPGQGENPAGCRLVAPAPILRASGHSQEDNILDQDPDLTSFVG